MSTPIVIGYDGTDLADHAIAQAGRQLAAGQDALVVTVWQTADLNFTPVEGTHVDADRAPDVRAAAEAVAARGAELATAAGFAAKGIAVEASPVWKGLVSVLDEHAAEIVVLGAHRHGALAGRLFGHVTADVLTHTGASVLVVRQPD